MDGIIKNENIVVIGATNRPDTLDAALLRPGRFDTQVVVDKPDVNGREAILKVHTREKPLAPDVDLRSIAQATPGFVGADLENITNEAVKLAVRQKSDLITQEHLNQAFYKVLLGSARKGKLLSDAEKKMVAYHEAGHVVAKYFTDPTAKLQHVTIIPRTKALGFAEDRSGRDSYIKTKQDLLRELVFMFGGRAAEDLIFQDISTGAANDLQKANEQVARMVNEWGMSEELGNMVLTKESSAHGISSNGYNWGFVTMSLRDQAIKRILDEAYDRTKSVLQDNRNSLDRLATTLLEKESLNAEEIEEILKAK